MQLLEGVEWEKGGQQAGLLVCFVAGSTVTNSLTHYSLTHSRPLLLSHLKDGSVCWVQLLAALLARQEHLLPVHRCHLQMPK